MNPEENFCYKGGDLTTNQSEIMKDIDDLLDLGKCTTIHNKAISLDLYDIQKKFQQQSILSLLEEHDNKALV